MHRNFFMNSDAMVQLKVLNANRNMPRHTENVMYVDACTQVTPIGEENKEKCLES